MGQRLKAEVKFTPNWGRYYKSGQLLLTVIFFGLKMLCDSVTGYASICNMIN